MRRVIPILILLGTFAPGLSWGADESKAKREFGLLMDGMRDARERLRSGIYRATGRLAVKTPTAGLADGDCVLFCAFDDDKHWFRFDREQPVKLPDAESKVDDDKPRQLVLRQMAGKFARTPEQTVYWDTDSANLTVSSPSDVSVLLGLVHPFDVRTIGLLGWSGYQINTAFSDILQVLTSQKIISIISDGPSIFHITELFGEADFARRDLWIDANRGYSPIRLELRYKLQSGIAEEWPAPTVVSESTWNKTGEVWVPATFTFDEGTNSPHSVHQQLQFEWQSVNAPVDEQFFEPEGFDVDPDTIIVDRRLGKPIIIGKVGDPDYEPPPPFAVAPNGNTWNSKIVVAVAVVLLAIGIAWYRKRQAS